MAVDHRSGCEGQTSEAVKLHSRVYDLHLAPLTLGTCMRCCDPLSSAGDTGLGALLRISGGFPGGDPLDFIRISTSVLRRQG